LKNWGKLGIINFGSVDKALFIGYDTNKIFGSDEGKEYLIPSILANLGRWEPGMEH